MFSFKDFEKYVEKKILERGFEYYEYDQVSEIEKIDKGEFTALVQGSEEYEVFVKIKDGMVVKQTCTCPYDWGDVCKHVVAVLYYLQDAGLNSFQEDTSIKEQLKIVLKEVSGKELRKFIYQYAKQNRDFREDFFAEFG